MIYFDNAATTQHKPERVGQAVLEAMGSFGGVGRGVHGASLSAGMAVYEARDALADLLGAPDASRVSFTSNATEALNIALMGLLKPGDHAVTTAASHNSVLRPLHLLKNHGVEVTCVSIGPDGSLDFAAYEAAFRPNTKLAVITHGSNLTGDVYDIAWQAQVAHSHDALVVVDAAQTAGVIPLDMAAQKLDVVCFTGHKALYGPQGTGGLAVADGVEIPPFKVGGTGTHSYDLDHPLFMPECLEAGTLNGHGIAGLAAGVAFIKEMGIDAIAAHEAQLVSLLEQGIADVPGIRILGGHGGVARTGIVALNLGTADSGLIADRLNMDWDICTRAGAHCAPLMHKALGTEFQGAVRFSFSWFNTSQQVQVAVDALHELAERLG